MIDMTIRTVETTTSAASIDEKDIFDIGSLKEFTIKLINNGGMADIVDFNKIKRDGNNI